MIELGALAILGSVFAWREWCARQERNDWAKERGEWTLERSGLLNRIKPETAQYTPVDDFVIPEPEPEEWFDENGSPYGKPVESPWGVNGGS